MKFLIIALFALASCAGEPQVADPAAPQSQDLAEIVTLSPSEKAAIKAEQEFIDEMASEGIYPETTPTQITVKYHKSGLTIGLYNESYISQTDYYQQERSSAIYKVIPDMKMGALHKALTDGGFFEDATDGIKRYAGADVSIIIRRGNKSYSLAWGSSVNEDLRKVTEKSSNSIRLMYDTTRSIQVIGNTSGGDFFQEESNRIIEANRDAVQRLKPRQ
jgi:hypothetical protein